jgi:hypothetical protein
VLTTTDTTVGLAVFLHRNLPLPLHKRFSAGEKVDEEEEERGGGKTRTKNNKGSTGGGGRVRFHPAPDSLNSRFLVLNDLATDAVFAVDDDIKVSCADLKFAFEVWASTQHTLVGFYPRLHTPTAATATTATATATAITAEPTGGTAAAAAAVARTHEIGDRVFDRRSGESGGGGGVAAILPRFEYHSWWYVWWTGRYSMILTKVNSH